MKFTVPGLPVPKGRPRFGKGRTYTPARTKDYERKVKFYALQVRPQRLTGPVAWTCFIYLPDKRRRDRDNIEKAIQDALNGIAYEDDSQIVEWHGALAVDAANPRVEVRIEAVGA